MTFIKVLYKTEFYSVLIDRNYCLDYKNNDNVKSVFNPLTNGLYELNSSKRVHRMLLISLFLNLLTIIFSLFQFYKFKKQKIVIRTMFILFNFVFLNLFSQNYNGNFKYIISFKLLNDSIERTNNYSKIEINEVEDYSSIAFDSITVLFQNNSFKKTSFKNKTIKELLIYHDSLKTIYNIKNEHIIKYNFVENNNSNRYIKKIKVSSSDSIFNVNGFNCSKITLDDEKIKYTVFYSKNYPDSNLRDVLFTDDILYYEIKKIIPQYYFIIKFDFEFNHYLISYDLVIENNIIPNVESFFIPQHIESRSNKKFNKKNEKFKVFDRIK